ncbi:dienelactone hydrolase family protein [Streptococcus sp. 2021WUSS124]|uniref:dienelactone hydrolase family protein n=1 Tax=unclassified Streptococcus TaxID=2608887 RepID=UPI003789894C
MTQFSIIGYSAGANYAALASELLVKEQFDLAGQDPISQKAKPFIEDMKEAGRTVDVIEYPEAVHSFIESNNPEGLTGATTDMSQVVNAEQENLARQAEAAIGDWLDSQK